MTNLNDRIPQINGVIKYSFCRASLILINEGLDQLFSIATGIDDRFFRVYLAFQDQERGLLLSYNHADNNFYSASIFDAIASVVSYEERIAFGWNDSEIETIFETIIQETAHATSFVYKMVKPVRISFETSTGTDFFYGIVIYKPSDWSSQRIPERLINNYLLDFKQKIQHISKELTSPSLRVSGYIYRYLNPMTTIRLVCENELSDLFGNKKAEPKIDLFDFICNLACKPYEGAQNKGVIRFASEADISKNDNLIRFVHPIRCEIENTREIRKLLEMTDRDTPLVVKQSQVIGLGRKNTRYSSLVFEGNGKWKLFPNESASPILLVEGNRCTFTGTTVQDAFSAVFQSVFPSYKNDLVSIHSVVESAKKQRHGTSIVICNKAMEESKRLAKNARAILIEPISLTESKDSIAKLTSIDGAIIVSPDGMCYSIGAILDGEAIVMGDTARGARYNSLKNYVVWRTKSDKTYQVMAVVISEDQTTDILPPY